MYQCCDDDDDDDDDDDEFKTEISSVNSLLLFVAINSGSSNVIVLLEIYSPQISAEILATFFSLQILYSHYAYANLHDSQ